MDNLAHTLIGIGVARAGLSRRFGPGTTATLAIASNLPDVDALWTLWDPIDRFVLRRQHSHSLVALPVLAAALALVVWWKRRDRPWSTLFGLSALGVALHLLFDLVNAFGVVLLWPFSDQRFELACVFVVDPVIWSLMGLPLLVGRFLRSDLARLRLWRGAVALLFVYTATCQLAHIRTETLMRRHLGPSADFRLFPEPFGPTRFRAVHRTGDAWRIYLCRPFTGGVEQVDLVPTDTDQHRSGDEELLLDDPHGGSSARGRALGSVGWVRWLTGRPRRPQERAARVAGTERSGGDSRHAHGRIRLPPRIARRAVEARRVPRARPRTARDRDRSGRGRPSRLQWRPTPRTLEGRPVRPPGLEDAT